MSELCVRWRIGELEVPCSNPAPIFFNFFFFYFFFLKIQLTETKTNIKNTNNCSFLQISSENHIFSPEINVQLGCMCIQLKRNIILCCSTTELSRFVLQNRMSFSSKAGGYVFECIVKYAPKLKTLFFTNVCYRILRPFPKYTKCLFFQLQAQSSIFT